MYSHGSSARVGVGKQGHGGRPYRPPRKRRDPNSVPPTLKECSCLVEIHLPEYQQAQPIEGRQHASFGGRQATEQCEKTIRTEYQCHLQVPGKKQAGPVAVVAKSYREALPALVWLMLEGIHLPEDDRDRPPIRGRIHRNVKDNRDVVLEGMFPNTSIQEESETPFWLFQSPDWSVLACSLTGPSDNGSQNVNNGEATTAISSDNEAPSTTPPGVPDRATVLQTCLDNLVFRLGEEAIGKLDIFVDPYAEYSFAVGDPAQAEVMRREIAYAFQATS